MTTLLGTSINAFIHLNIWQPMVPYTYPLMVGSSFLIGDEYICRLESPGLPIDGRGKDAPHWFNRSSLK